ncbi:hypothetical protein H310_04503 [Aphanomyces invadans]|uniref:Uncharacterized protein n=1 Tax=Aphanomyces invadans TaxID=157072 RepID=A0A024UE21_9STRA|nr:hypothetical protein H310_04503 [Aphanomyces invadans]ETW04147.1 hypothetical protein H310_04503 [Aphanomyces invadans]|eukprot:XP_008867103.1 hypothetical protein H310_04503 [Aphanomyces invadans]
MSPTTTHLKEEKSNSLVFAGANFNIYKVRIQAKLRSKGLWKVVSGEETGEEAEDDDDYDSKEDRPSISSSTPSTTITWPMCLT